jgi:anti-sigma B factor antagonist
MRYETLPSGALVVTLLGRMDINGAMEIDVHFTNMVSAYRSVIVDLSEVEFLASMGLRTLILGAKSVQSTKNGRMVLLNPRKEVERVLVSSGTDSLIPVCHDRADAERRAVA